MSSENRDVILRIPSYTGPTVQLWDVPETAVATYSYTGSGGVTWGGAATSVAFFVSSYQYAVGALALSPDDSDLSLGTHFTKITSEGANERPLTIELPPLSVGSKNEYWFTLPGFPGLVDWPANLIFPFEFYIARTVTSGGAGTVFFSVARVQTDGTLIDECPEVSLGSIDISGAGTTKTGSTAAYSFTSGSATDRLRIKIRLNITSIMSSPSVRFRLENKAVPQFGGWISTAALFGASLTFGGASSIAVTHAYAAFGGITFGGTATYAETHAYASAGGILFGGVSAVAHTSSYAGAGGITFGGTASKALSRAYTATGGIDFGGAATTTYTPGAGAVTYTYAGSGGILFGGVAGIVGPPPAIDHSGGFRRVYVQAKIIEVPDLLHIALGQVRVSTTSVAQAVSLPLQAEIGQVTVTGSVLSTSADAALPTLAIGAVRVSAPARAPAGSLTSLLLEIGQVSVQSMAQAPVSVQRVVPIALGRVTVHIGPDLVEEEFDEILFLLEVA